MVYFRRDCALYKIKSPVYVIRTPHEQIINGCSLFIASVRVEYGATGCASRAHRFTTRIGEHGRVSGALSLAACYGKPRAKAADRSPCAWEVDVMPLLSPLVIHGIGL